MKERIETSIYITYYEFCKQMIQLANDNPGIIREEKIKEYENYIKNNEPINEEN